MSVKSDYTSICIYIKSTVYDVIYMFVFLHKCIA